MRKIEFAFIVIALISIGLLLSTIRGSALFLTLSLLPLASLYMFAGFLIFNNIGLRKMLKKDAFEAITSGMAVRSIISGVLLSIPLISILFKLNMWAGAGVLMVNGGVFIVILFIMSLIFYLMQASVFNRRLLIYASCYLAVFLLVAAVPYSTIAGLHPWVPRYRYP